MELNNSNYTHLIPPAYLIPPHHSTVEEMYGDGNVDSFGKGAIVTIVSLPCQADYNSLPKCPGMTEDMWDNHLHSWTQMKFRLKPHGDWDEDYVFLQEISTGIDINFSFSPFWIKEYKKRYEYIDKIII